MINNPKITTLTGKAYAKINLSLDIISKMDDGYHALKTVMQTVSLCDEVTIELGIRNYELEIESEKGSNRITVDPGLPYIPNDSRNVAAKAAEAFFEHTGIAGCDVKISIKKRIPVCAGLGGGSADAACVLRMLNEMFVTKLGRETLEKLGYAVGADVPFCIDGATKLAQGRGEILTDLPPIPKSYVVICKPPFSYSTPELFSQVNCKQIRTRPDTDGLLKAIDAGDITGTARRMYNVFDDFLHSGRKAEIDLIKGSLLEYGALGTVMTGSGPSVFGLFADKNSAQTAHLQLAQAYKDCFLAQTVQSV